MESYKVFEKVEEWMFMLGRVMIEYKSEGVSLVIDGWTDISYNNNKESVIICLEPGAHVLEINLKGNWTMMDDETMLCFAQDNKKIVFTDLSK